MDKDLAHAPHTPRVTVLMPVYNGERFILEAVESILAQNFADFELLVINDGSTDDSAAMVQAYADKRLHLIHNDKNLGLIATLNKGLDLARGEYILRMDCDDICLPERLARQVAFLDAHPEVGVCGVWYREFGDGPNKITRCAPDHASIKCGTLFNPVVGHPSVIIRKELLGKHGLRYDPTYVHAEDYELWSRCLKYFKFANIEEILMFYRVHLGQVTQSRLTKQMESAGKVRLRLIRELGIEPSDEEFQIHQTLSALGRPYSTSFDGYPLYTQLEKIDQWLCRLKKANDKNPIYPEPAFSRILVERWLGVCFLKFASKGMWSGRLLREPRIAKLVDSGWKHALRFILLQLSYLMRDSFCSFKPTEKKSLVANR